MTEHPPAVVPARPISPNRSEDTVLWVEDYNLTSGEANRVLADVQISNCADYAPTSASTARRTRTASRRPSAI